MYRSIFRPFISSVLILGVLATSACSKKEPAAPGVGSVTGVVSPVDAAATVTLNDQSNAVVASTTANGTTGAFTFSGAQVGGYTVNVQPTRGYVAPTPRPVTISGGQTVDIGQIRVQGDGTPHGTVTWRVNGTNYQTTNLTGFIRPTEISIMGTAQNGSTVDNIYLTVSNFNGRPSTYTVTTSAADPFRFYGIYARFVNSVPSIEYNTGFSSPGITPSGSLNITAADATAKTLQGDFSFLGGVRYGSGPGPVTNGTFTIHY